MLVSVAAVSQIPSRKEEMDELETLCPRSVDHTKQSSLVVLLAAPPSLPHHAVVAFL